MIKDYPYVPRVTFAGIQHGDAHIVCGNGAHYLWSAEQEQWIELAPLPNSAQAEMSARQAAVKKQAETKRIAVEVANADYNEQRQAALKKQAQMRKCMTLEAFVVGVLREHNFLACSVGYRFVKLRNQGITKNSVVREVVQSSRSQWDAGQITACLMDCVQKGLVYKIEKDGSHKPYILYRLTSKATVNNV